MRNVGVVFGALAGVLSGSVSAATKDCAELKGEIEAKLQTKGVRNLALEIVSSDAIKDEKVVGPCAAGAKKIVYKRN